MLQTRKVRQIGLPMHDSHWERSEATNKHNGLKVSCCLMDTYVVFSKINLL